MPRSTLVVQLRFPISHVQCLLHLVGDLSAPSDYPSMKGDENLSVVVGESSSLVLEPAASGHQLEVDLLCAAEAFSFQLLYCGRPRRSGFS
jgi:hypothetical protein